MQIRHSRSLAVNFQQSDESLPNACLVFSAVMYYYKYYSCDII